MPQIDKEYVMKYLVTLVVCLMLWLASPAQAAVHDHGMISCGTPDCQTLEGGATRAAVWFMNFYACPGPLCFLIIGDTYVLDILVTDREVCQTYHYDIRLKVGPLTDLNVTIDWDDAGSNQHCAVQIPRCNGGNN